MTSAELVGPCDVENSGQDLDQSVSPIILLPIGTKTPIETNLLPIGINKR